MKEQPNGRERLENLLVTLESLLDSFADGYDRRGKGFTWVSVSLPEPMWLVVTALADELLEMANENRIKTVPLKCVDKDQIEEWIVLARGLRRDLQNLIRGRKPSPSQIAPDGSCDVSVSSVPVDQDSITQKCLQKNDSTEIEGRDVA